jgi:hypothetical protein
MVEDEEIKPIVDHALHLSKSHIKKLTTLFKEEKHHVPHGFTIEEDVDIHAPRLYTDSYVLNFINLMAKIGMTNYAAAISASVRADITEYYTECMAETIGLYKKSKELLLQKGLFIRSPYLLNPTEVEYVKKQGFVWDVIGEKRPLIASEIGNLFTNIQRNALGSATLTGFSQVAESKDVTQFFTRGIEIGNKHIRLFSEKLQESNLPIPSTWAAEITTSTNKTFSDKLMMFFTSGMISLSVGYYGTAIAQSPRADIGVLYNRLSLEVQLYSEDGANIMIKNGWMEQPPMAADRDQLAHQKQK